MLEHVGVQTCASVNEVQNSLAPYSSSRHSDVYMREAHLCMLSCRYVQTRIRLRLKLKTWHESSGEAAAAVTPGSSASGAREPGHREVSHRDRGAVLN